MNFFSYIQAYCRKSELMSSAS